MNNENTKCFISKGFKGLSQLFKSLGDSNRLNILQHICSTHAQGQEKCNVGELASCCEVDLSVVSRHLNDLKNAGVLNAKREGKHVNYSLNAKELAQTLRDLADYIEACECSPNTKGVTNEC